MGAIRAFFLFQMKMYTVLKNRNRWRFLQWKGRFGLGQITGQPGRFGSEPQCSGLYVSLCVCVSVCVCAHPYVTDAAVYTALFQGYRNKYKNDI